MLTGEFLMVTRPLLDLSQGRGERETRGNNLSSANCLFCCCCYYYCCCCKFPSFTYRFVDTSLRSQHPWTTRSVQQYSSAAPHHDDDDDADDNDNNGLPNFCRLYMTCLLSTKSTRYPHNLFSFHPYRHAYTRWYVPPSPAHAGQAPHERVCCHLRDGRLS